MHEIKYEIQTDVSGVVLASGKLHSPSNTLADTYGRHIGSYPLFLH